MIHSSSLPFTTFSRSHSLKVLLILVRLWSMDLVRMPSECSGSPSSFIHPHLRSEPAASPATRSSGSERGRRHAEPSFLRATRSRDRPERSKETRNKSESSFRHEKRLLLSTHLFLRPLSVSICLLRGYSRLWHLFLCLLGSRGRRRCGSCYTAC